MIKGLVFDLDGVLTDTAQYHFKAWQAMAKSININIDESFNEKLKGISRMESLDIILKSAGKENDYTDAQKEALATKKNDLYLSYISKLTSEDILPGMENLLKQAKSLDLKLSIASASRNAPAILKNLGIADYFSYTVDPAKLKHGKPAPDIYILGAQGVGLTPANTVGFEDAAAGVQAINAAKMFSVGIGDDKILKAADIVYPKTADISLDQVLEIANDR